jgi:predicted aspartyl protease
MSPMIGTRPLCAILGIMVAVAAGAAPDGGVLAEFPFLDEIPDYGEVDAGHIAIDLSPYPTRRFPLLLDTGASSSVMTPRYARSVGVSVRAAKDSFYRKSTVLGRDLQFWVDTRRSDTGRWALRDVGVLGGNFLDRYVVEVDYEKRRVRFLDPDRHAVSEDSAAPGEIVVPMRLSDHRPALEIRLGSGSAWFIMDTGAPHDLGISEEKARALGLEAGPEDRAVAGRNYLGSDRWLSKKIRRATVGSFDVIDPTLSIAIQEGSSYRTTNLAGADQAILGNEFMRRFRVRFDYPHRKLSLLPRPPESIAAEAAAHDLPEAAPEPTPVPERAVSGAPPPLPQVEPDAPARVAAPREHQVWLELTSPSEGAVAAGAVDWIEVAGWAGSRKTVAYDIAVVVDVSGSTAYASGVDVDQNGKLGKARRRRENWRNFNPRHFCSDPGDTILAAELRATQRLVDLLDPNRSRIGLLSFADHGQLHAAIGSDREVFSDVLQALEQSFGSGWTNLAHAVRLATEALVNASKGELDPPLRAILILSDGYPTFPGSEENAAKAALDAAQEADALDVRIYTFALGLGEIREEDVFAKMAIVTGGEHVRVDKPGEIVQELPLINLAQVADVAIQNVSADERGRATRILPDGSFDGFVKLHPGENRIRVTARAEGGAERSVERRLWFESREPRDAREAEAFAREREKLLGDLRVRTVEAELVHDMRLKRRARQAQLRKIEVSVDESDRED